MSAHTPEPWEITRTIRPYTEPGADNDYPGVEISFRDGGPGTGEMDHYHEAAIQIWSHRAKADGRLVIAAPKLLARLKARRANCVCPDQPSGSAVCDDCKADSRVIALAEGHK